MSNLADQPARNVSPRGRHASTHRVLKGLCTIFFKQIYPTQQVRFRRSVAKS